MSKNIHLTIIDPQLDFAHPKGSLFVPGGDKDMQRLADMINRLGNKIRDIHVTLDSHRFVDIAHPIMHVNSKGEHPAPFTIISEEDYENGTWKCTNPAWQKRISDYVHQLATNNRYPLCIWPPHTLIASTRKVEAQDEKGDAVIVDGKPLMVDFCGHAVVEPVASALLNWEDKNFGLVDYISKGSNVLVEHYSIVKSEIEDPADSTTMLNTELIDVLQKADEILISGEALSHCVANSIRDIADNFGDENIKKFVLLEDTCSNVPGFENLGTDFVRDMTARGMQVTTSVDYLA